MGQTVAKIRVNVPCNIEDIFVFRHDQPFFSISLSAVCLSHYLVGIACFGVWVILALYLMNGWLVRCLDCFMRGRRYVSDVILMGGSLSFALLLLLSVPALFFTSIMLVTVKLTSRSILPILQTLASEGPPPQRKIPP